MLQQGLFLEEAEQHLAEASKHYEAVIASYEQHRGLAVAALFRLAEVRRKQGRGEDAANAYQRLLAEFPDADPQSRLSRERLRSMGVAVAAPVEKVPADPDEERELRRLMMVKANNPEQIADPVSGRERLHPLNFAAAKGWMRVVEWLLDEGVPVVREKGRPALLDAAMAGHIEVCDLLLRRGATIGQGEVALVEAVHENKPIADWLIQNGADIDVVGSVYIPNGEKVFSGSPFGRSAGFENQHARVSVSALTAAILRNDKIWTDRLLELGADPDGSLDPAREDGASMGPLHAACLRGHGKLVERLLADGANPSLPDRLRNPTQIQLRGSAGRLPSGFSGEGWTPLHYAADNAGIVASLIRHGAEVNAADATGITPLHNAVSHANTEVMTALLAAKAEPNGVAEKTPPGPPPTGERRETFLRETPFMLASRCDIPAKAQSMCALLSDHGANFAATNALGHDVFSFCDVPTNNVHLVENYLLPELVEQAAIHLVFPEIGASFALATKQGEDEAPPRFASLLLDWRPETELRRTESAFMWETPSLRRKLERGGIASTPVRITAVESFPAMEWGDVIEFKSDRSDLTFLPQQPDSRTRNLRPASHARGAPSPIPWHVESALASALPREVTLHMPGQEPRKVRVNDALLAATPFGDLPGARLEDFLAPLQGIPVRDIAIGIPPRNRKTQPIPSHGTSIRRGAGLHWDIGTGVEIRRGDQPLAREGLPAHLKRPVVDGDIITIRREEALDRKDWIRLIEPKTGYRIVSVPIFQECDHASLGSPYPSLFQLISMAYPSSDPRDWIPPPPGTARPSPSRHPPTARSTATEAYGRWCLDVLRAFLGEHEGEMPSGDEIREALAFVAHRMRWNGQFLLTHPDSSVVRIRRLAEDQGEKTMEIPLGDFISACTDETSAAECRAKDIDLKPGDIVELKAHYDRVDQPWPGFDEKTRRFLEKALTYTIHLMEGEETEGDLVTATWRAPSYVHTRAGPIGLQRDGKAINDWTFGEVLSRMLPDRRFRLGVHLCASPETGKDLPFLERHFWIRHDVQLPYESSPR